MCNHKSVSTLHLGDVCKHNQPIEPTNHNATLLMIYLVPEMTYYVSSGTLNSTNSTNSTDIVRFSLQFENIFFDGRYCRAIFSWHMQDFCRTTISANLYHSSVTGFTCTDNTSVRHIALLPANHHHDDDDIVIQNEQKYSVLP